MRRTGSNVLQRDRIRFAAIALIPVILYLGVFLLYPVVMTFLNSFRDLKTREFVGIANYREYLFEDPRGWPSIRNTFTYALIRIPATIIPGFLFANMLYRRAKGRGPIIFGFFAPYITSMVAFCSIFVYLYANNGLFNAILAGLGLPTMGFIRSVTQALPSVALMDAWKHIGFDVVLFLVALQHVPRSLLEAAEIDGASGLQTVLRIKLPLIQPTIVYLVVVLLIWTMQVFEPIYVMTGGGPVDVTTTIMYEVYFSGFRSFRLGYASAISYILFAFLLIATVVQLRVGRTRWSY